MPDQLIEQQKAFMVQVITVVQTSHGHNLTAGEKRLESAVRLFLSSVCFDPSTAAAIREVVAAVGDRLSMLRVIDAQDDEGTAKVKSGALNLTRELDLITQEAELPELALVSVADKGRHSAQQNG